MDSSAVRGYLPTDEKSLWRSKKIENIVDNASANKYTIIVCAGAFFFVRSKHTCPIIGQNDYYYNQKEVKQNANI